MSTIMKAQASSDRELNLNPKIRLPKNRYALRIKEEEFKLSNSKGAKGGNNPMLVLTFEYVAPDSIQGNQGERINIAGVEINQKKYMVLSVKDEETGEVDPERSQKAFNQYGDLCNLLGVDISEGVDIENPPKKLKGLVVDAIVESEEYEQRMDPTPEQAKAGKKGELIKDADGSPIKAYFTKVVDIRGLGDQSLGKKLAF